MKVFYDKVSQILEEVVEKKYKIRLTHPLWQLPQRQEFGDLSSMVAMKLASELKKDPLEIATEIKSILDKKLSKDLDKIEVLKPGFVNIFLSKKTLIDSLNQILKTEDKFFRHNIKKKILIEFLSANPTGPLSIAHGRQAVIGDTIANILDFFGNKVQREYYLNDAGTQLKLYLDSVDAQRRIQNGEDVSIPERGYKGDYISNTASTISIIASNNSEQTCSREFVRKHALDIEVNKIKKDLSDLKIEFDSWFSQRKLIEEGKVDEVINFLDKKGLLYEKEDALWFKATQFGDDKDRVIRKADGELTYFASDIAYHKDKIQRKYDKLINLWGPDHHGYIKRVKKSIKALGYNEDILEIIIIQLVTLKSKERMSKRAGTMIKLCELIDEVGPGAARFYYLTRRNSSHLEFDIDLAKEKSINNPLYYIQYANARIESIFAKLERIDFKNSYSQYLSNEEEIGLLRNLLQFSYTLERAYLSHEPVFIIEFLKNLASCFHKFYEKVRVIDQDKNITAARVNLLGAVRVVLHTALGILGIEPVQKM